MLFTLSLIAALALAAISLVVACVVVGPEMARILIGKPRAGEAQLPRSKRVLYTLALGAGCGGAVMAWAGAISFTAALTLPCYYQRCLLHS